MRSRYSAFVSGDADYLLATWHPTTRPAGLDLSDGPAWQGLEVLAATGGLLDPTGSVRFRASYDGGVLEETSRFVRDGGRWSYLAPERP